jgi:hypothetical protein
VCRFCRIFLLPAFCLPFCCRIADAATANQYVDEVLRSVQAYVQDNQLSEIGLPDLTFPFGSGEIVLDQGHVRNLASLTRTGDISLDFDEMTGAITVYGSMGLSELDVYYRINGDFPAALLFPRVRGHLLPAALTFKNGQVVIHVGENSIFLNVGLIIAVEPVINLNDLYFEYLRDVKIEFLDSGARCDELLSKWVTDLYAAYNGEICALLNGYLPDLIAQILPGSPLETENSRRGNVALLSGPLMKMLEEMQRSLLLEPIYGAHVADIFGAYDVLRRIFIGGNKSFSISTHYGCDKTAMADGCSSSSKARGLTLGHSFSVLKDFQGKIFGNFRENRAEYDGVEIIDGDNWEKFLAGEGELPPYAVHSRAVGGGVGLSYRGPLGEVETIAAYESLGSRDADSGGRIQLRSDVFHLAACCGCCPWENGRFSVRPDFFACVTCVHSVDKECALSFFDWSIPVVRTRKNFTNVRVAPGISVQLQPQDNFFCRLGLRWNRDLGKRPTSPLYGIFAGVPITAGPKNGYGEGEVAAGLCLGKSFLADAKLSSFWGNRRGIRGSLSLQKCF